MNKQFTSMAALVAAAGMGLHAQASVVTVDGVLTDPNEYSRVFELDFRIPNTIVNHTGILRLTEGSNADGTTGGSNDIFALLEVPTGITDLTFGANTAPDWAGTKDTDNGQIEYGKVQGSETFKFKLDVNGSLETVQVKMKDTGDAGFEVRSDGGGALLSASTSLDNNLRLFGDQFIVDSPECGSTLGSPTSDSDCYLNPVAGAEDYEFAQIYEFQFDGTLFNLNDLADFIGAMSFTESHASPPKGRQANATFRIGCIDAGNTCNDISPSAPPPPPPPPVAASEPGTIALFMSGLLALMARRKAVKATR